MDDQMSVSFPQLIAVILFLAHPLFALAQQPSVSQSSQTGTQPAQSIRIGSEEVLLDVIVRDKKGRPVRDLKAEEIQVYEDSVKQKINSFRLLEFEGGVIDPSAKPSRSSTQLPSQPFDLDPSRQINLVSMVFDSLDANGRKLAREAALDFVATGMRSNVMVAGFTVSGRFYVLQQFTSSAEKVRQAIDLATGCSEVQYADVSKQMVEQMEIIANAADFGLPANAPAQAQAVVVPGASNPQISFSLQSAGLPSTGRTEAGLELIRQWRGSRSIHCAPLNWLSSTNAPALQFKPLCT